MVDVTVPGDDDALLDPRLRQAAFQRLQTQNQRRDAGETTGSVRVGGGGVYLGDVRGCGRAQRLGGNCLSRHQDAGLGVSVTVQLRGEEATRSETVTCSQVCLQSPPWGRRPHAGMHWH